LHLLLVNTRKGKRGELLLPGLFVRNKKRLQHKGIPAIAVAASISPTRLILLVQAVLGYLYGGWRLVAVYISISNTPRDFLFASGQAITRDQPGSRVSKRGGVVVAIAERARGGGIWVVGEQLDTGITAGKGDLFRN
jgi:hypothetical protein